jgi:hypothetical protein
MKNFVLCYGEFIFYDLARHVSFGGIFAIRCIKPSAVFVVIAFYDLTGIYCRQFG